MSLFSHRSSSTTNASDHNADRTRREPLPELATSVSGRRLAGRVVGCGAAALSAVLVFAACASSTPAKTSTASPKDDKVFHSTAEAKKAAVDASQRYWDAYVKAQNNPDNAETELSAVAEKGEVDRQLDGISEAEKEGRHLDGVAKVLSFGSTSENFGSKSFRLEGIVCINFESLRWLDREGRDITNPKRANLQAIAIAYGVDPQNSKQLVVRKHGSGVNPKKHCA